MEQEQKHFTIPKGIYQKVGWLIIVLIILFALMALKTLKEFRFVGKGANETNQFVVTGKGEAFATPDVAKISFTVEKEATTVKEANTTVDEKVKKAMDFLKEKKVAEKDIKTVSNSFYPQYDYPICVTYPCTQTPKLRGYNSSRTIEVKVRDLDSAASIVEGLGGLAVTNLVGPEFTLSDEDVVQTEARNDAIKDARAKAEVLADALGVKIVRIINFSESTGGYNPAQPQPFLMQKNMSADMASGSAAPESLPQGQNKYTSDVSIVYEIR